MTAPFAHKGLGIALLYFAQAVAMTLALFFAKAPRASNLQIGSYEVSIRRRGQGLNFFALFVLTTVVHDRLRRLLLCASSTRKLYTADAHDRLKLVDTLVRENLVNCAQAGTLSRCC
jgi:hypothetical protein